MNTEYFGEDSDGENAWAVVPPAPAGAASGVVEPATPLPLPLPSSTNVSPAASPVSAVSAAVAPAAVGLPLLPLQPAKNGALRLRMNSFAAQNENATPVNLSNGPAPLPGAAGAPEPVRTTVQILFVRHSESCANMLKRAGRGREQAGYLDPELTARGLAMAAERGAQLAALIPQVLGTTGPLYIAASVLRRTQQTALALSQNGLASLSGRDTNGFIYVLPFIGEVSSTAAATVGLSRDNTPMPRQSRSMPSSVIFDLFDKEPGGGTPSVEKFFTWLGKQTRNPGFLLDAPSAQRDPVIRMVVVTHAGWMRKLAGTFSRDVPKYQNLDAAAVTVEYGDDGVPRREPYWIQGRDNRSISLLSYIPSDAVAAVACPDKCSGARICSGSEGDACRWISLAYTNAATISGAFLSNLEKDLRIMESYRRSPRPQVIAALDTLRKYFKGGLFGGKNRADLAKDLLPLAAAYGCSVGSDAGACQTVTRLLQDPAKATNAEITALANAARAPALKNYTRKSGWFRPTYVKDRATLRANLERIRETTCAAGGPSVAPPAPQRTTIAVPRDGSTWGSWWGRRGGARKTRRHRRHRHRHSTTRRR